MPSNPKYILQDWTATPWINIQLCGDQQKTTLPWEIMHQVCIVGSGKVCTVLWSTLPTFFVWFIVRLRVYSCCFSKITKYVWLKKVYCPNSNMVNSLVLLHVSILNKNGSKDQQIFNIFCMHCLGNRSFISLCSHKVLKRQSILQEQYSALLGYTDFLWPTAR